MAPLRALALQQSGNAHLFHAVHEELPDRRGTPALTTRADVERSVVTELGVRHCDLPTLDVALKSALVPPQRERERERDGAWRLYGCRKEILC